MLKQVKFILVDYDSRNETEYAAPAAINIEDVSSMHKVPGSYAYPDIVEVCMRNGDIHRVKGVLGDLLESEE